MAGTYCQKGRRTTPQGIMQVGVEGMTDGGRPEELAENTKKGSKASDIREEMARMEKSCFSRHTSSGK